MNIQSLDCQAWFLRLPLSQRELIKQSFYLLIDAKEKKLRMFDYAYILMPAAKAYEGFVKDLVYSLHLISEKRYFGRRFRVGRALNPEYANREPDGFEALYDDLARLCGGEEIAAALWDTWLQCRNQVFHYFVQKQHNFSLFEAEEKLNLIIKTIKTSSFACKLQKDN